VTEQRPLLENSDDELELALLGAVRAERPSAHGLRDTALALGLGAGVAHTLATTLPTTSSATSAATSAASGTAATVGVSSAVGTVSVGAVGKSLIGGALLSFLALTTIDKTLETSPSPAVPATAAPRSAYETRESPPAPSSDVVPVLVEPSMNPQASPASPGLGVGSRRVAPRDPSGVPVTDSRPANQAPANAAFDSVAQPTPVAAATDASLAAETRLLDLARGALAAGDSERAGRLLDAYSSNRPSTVLAQEAALLRVRLLLARGQRPAAAELARRIIAQYPESAHVDSLRRLAAEP
jgi:hypothetical protein